MKKCYIPMFVLLGLSILVYAGEKVFVSDGNDTSFSFDGERLILPSPHPLPPPIPKSPQPQSQQGPSQAQIQQAYNAGFRDGSFRGRIDGERDGYWDGNRDGDRDGRWNGSRDGERRGREDGYKAGYPVDQASGREKGNIDGQNAGIKDGTVAGKNRCYNEGYSKGYNDGYAKGESEGLNDISSYNSGYAKGQEDAKNIEYEKGKKAGYQAGFSEREREIEESFPSFDILKLSKSIIFGKKVEGIPIEIARSGYITPEERQAYERGYWDGYHWAYRDAYNRSRSQAYNEAYTRAYREAYDRQYSISYREGYNEGKQKGWQDAYNLAYNSAYNYYFNQYKNMDYPQERIKGMKDGYDKGYFDGFKSGSQQQYDKGYKDGYNKTAQEVYPSAFEEGKNLGRMAADKYYHENAVLKVYDLGFYDENGDGKFEAGEGIFIKTEIRNIGFQKSNKITLSFKNARGEVDFVRDIQIDGIGGRNKTIINTKIGTIYDVALPVSDTLYVKILHNNDVVKDYSWVYSRINNNRVGIVNKDDTPVLKKPTWFFPGEYVRLKKDVKVIITGEDGNYYKVKKSAFISGGCVENNTDTENDPSYPYYTYRTDSSTSNDKCEWSEGYIKKDRLTLQ